MSLFFLLHNQNIIKSYKFILKLWIKNIGKGLKIPRLKMKSGRPPCDFLLRIFLLFLSFSLYFFLSLSCIFFFFNCVKWKIQLMRLQFIENGDECGRPFFIIFGLENYFIKFINWKINDNLLDSLIYAFNWILPTRLSKWRHLLSRSLQNFPLNYM